MMWEYFIHLAKKKSFLKMIYPANIFERRIQEEIVRTDNSNYFFVYTEFDFENLKPFFKTKEDSELFVRTLLNCLINDIRSSDAIGFLPKERGVGVLMPESSNNAFDRIVHAFANKIPERKDLCSVLKEKVNPIIYPLCLSEKNENSSR